MLFFRKNYIAFFVLSLGVLALLDWINQINILDYRIAAIVWILTMSSFIYSSYLLINDFQFESTYFKNIFYLFVIYEIFLLGRGILNGVRFFSPIDLYGFLHGYYLIWPLLIPLFVFFTKKISTFAVLFDWVYKLALIAIFIFLLFPSILVNRAPAELITPGLTYGCGIMLFFASYLKEKRITLAFVLIFLAFLSFTYLARRNNMVTIFGFILFSYLLNMRSSIRPTLYKFYPLLGIIAVVISLNFTGFTGTLTERLSERLTEDTRSDLLVPFFIEMDDYMYIGKGLQGTYYYPNGGELEDEGVVFSEVEYRDIIEVGYLQLYLTGGVVYVALFLLIMLPAAVIGVFKSSNLFSKACGIIIFLWLVDMVVYGLPILSFHYVFVWICVGICYKKSFRDKTDEEIRSEFQSLDTV